MTMTLSAPPCEAITVCHFIVDYLAALDHVFNLGEKVKARKDAVRLAQGSIGLSGHFYCVLRCLELLARGDVFIEQQYCSLLPLVTYFSLSFPTLETSNGDMTDIRILPRSYNPMECPQHFFALAIWQRLAPCGCIEVDEPLKGNQMHMLLFRAFTAFRTFVGRVCALDIR
jgi:hypothetical protein